MTSGLDEDQETAPTTNARSDRARRASTSGDRADLRASSAGQRRRESPVAAGAAPPAASSAPAGGHQQADLLAVAVAAVETATIAPRYMTADPVGQLEDLVELGRDQEEAVPASRLAIAWRWMNSTLPTSRPRVGWSSTSRRRSRSNSRATMTFCWLPPDSVPAAHGRRGRPDVELRDRLRRALDDGGLVAQGAARVRRVVVVVQDEVVRHRE